MKQFEPVLKTINGNRFYIRPFPAMKSAYISGEVFAFLSPLAASLLPAVGNILNSDNDSAFDVDIASAIPAITNSLGNVNGDKVEGMLRKLLIQYKNISVEQEDETEAQLLTEELSDEVFCGELQDMFILAYEVIQVNFPGIFKKLESRFGKLVGGFLATTRTSENTVPSILDNSQH